MSWMIQVFIEWPVFVTTLEIIQTDPLYCIVCDWLANDSNLQSNYSARKWHRHLCTCPKLRLLKTLKMPFMADYMDTLRRRSMYSPEGSSPLMPGIWICRGLQDLRSTFSACCECAAGYANCRQHPFVLEGGLRLLSRLKYLERLMVDCRSVECEIAELNWLCRSGRNEEHRVRSRQLIDGWAWRLEQEDALDTEGMRNRTLEDNNVIGEEGDYNDLSSSIRHLGLLHDVKEVLLEMDRRDFEYLSALQVVACGDHLPKPPEREMRSLFNMDPPGLVMQLAE
ncbi:hypothetical protein BGX30_005229 [Mortierella sp. GBA39]|nr:hypothetical protein BGX30_005229 [Mortierella sp. GBA39]